MAQPNENALIGRNIAGKFAVEAFIGSGAMGAVYRARQLALDKVVALKLLHRELARDATFPHRFIREAKAASRIDHPNSMRVIDFGEESDGTLYMAMEFLDGRDLFQVIQTEWPMAPARVADLVMQTLAALAVAHDMGVVHRDLKPENIMVLSTTDDEGRAKDLVKVCDFGIAKIIEERKEPTTDERGQGKLTTHGLVVGTPEYMSPEQGRGEPLDARADLYSVGVILYQLLAGTVPFEANSALGVVLKHVTDEPIPPSRRAPGVDKRLEAICLKAMSKAREDRYQSAREMRAELRQVLDGTAFAGNSPSSPAPPGALPRKTPVQTPHDLGIAATEVSIDPRAVRAASVRRYERRTSRLTPLGIDTELPPSRGRWAGHFLALILLLGVAGAGVYLFRGTLSAKATPVDTTPAAASAGETPGAAPSASQSVQESKSAAPAASSEPPAIPGSAKGAASAEELSKAGPTKGAPSASHSAGIPEGLLEAPPAAPSASAAAAGSAKAAPAGSASAKPDASAATAPSGKAAGKPKHPRPPSSSPPPSETPPTAPTWGVVPPTVPTIEKPAEPKPDPAPAPTE